MKLLGKLPRTDKDDGHERNGLDQSDVQTYALAHPDVPLFAVVELRVASITEHIDEGGWREPAVAVYRIEVAKQTADQTALLDELNRLAEARTGRQPELFNIASGEIVGGNL